MEAEIEERIVRLLAEDKPPSIPKGVEDDCRLWMIGNLRKLVEGGMRKVSARSTSKSERLKWANVVVNACKALDAVLANLQNDRGMEMFERVEDMVEGYEEGGRQSLFNPVGPVPPGSSNP